MLSGIQVKVVRSLRENYPWNCFLEIRKARNADTGSGLRMYFYGDTLTFTDRADKAEEYARQDEKLDVPL